MKILVYERQAGIAPISGAYAALLGSAGKDNPAQ